MGSVRRKGALARVTLESDEIGLLRALVVQVLELLDPGSPAADADPLEALVGMSSTPVEAPTDPALKRLLPDAYREDEEAAEEFRRLTDSDVRTAKRAALQRIVDALDSLAGAEPTRSGGFRLDLDEPAVSAWLPALTDVRLALASRFGIDEDVDAERSVVEPGTVRYDEIALYDWLSWLQDALVSVVAD
jgi:hypothetical protein